MSHRACYLAVCISGLLLFFQSCTPSDDEPTQGFKVEGIVTSENGTPLQGVLVNSIVDTVVTEESG
ncbi:MAG: hypothetical protein AAB316_00740, partial [Bacteroidota bacterium]